VANRAASCPRVPSPAAATEFRAPTTGLEMRQGMFDVYSRMTLIIVVVPVVLVSLIRLILILLARRLVASVTAVSRENASRKQDRHCPQQDRQSHG
jgi:hypothetical protein